MPPVASVAMNVGLLVLTAMNPEAAPNMEPIRIASGAAPKPMIGIVEETITVVMLASDFAERSMLPM